MPKPSRSQRKVSKLAKSGAQHAFTSHLSFADAAEQVLRKKGAALKYTEIVRNAIKLGLIQTESKTPEISMHVTLRSEIKRREQRNEPQRFMFLGNGLFTLVELMAGLPPKKTKSAVDQIRDSRKDACLQLYANLTKSNQGSNFETMVGDLLIAMGYADVQVIGGKDDQGVDIVCQKRDGIVSTKIAIQCKCKNLKQQIGPKDVSNLRDNLSTYQCQQGIIVTTTKLNDDAREKAREPGKDPVHVIEHDELLDLFAEHEIGLRKEAVNYFQVDASDYEFLK